MAAPFSAIIMVGALVLPDVIVGHDRGVDDAQPLDAGNTQPLVDHHHRIAGQTHLRRADGMKNRRADVARRFRQRLLVVVAHAGAGQILGRMIRRQCRLRDDVAGQPDRR